MPCTKTRFYAKVLIPIIAEKNVHNKFILLIIYLWVKYFAATKTATYSCYYS